MILPGLTFDDVLLVPNYGNESRDDGSVDVWLGPYHFDVPIISANMDTITDVAMACAMANLGGLGILHRFMSIDQSVEAYRAVGMTVGVSVGVTEIEYTRAEALYAAGARLFCVDVAHAHNKSVGRIIKHLKATYPGVYIIAGNAATYACADYLVSVGADAVKVGIGAGSICTTRDVTGFGVPQLTAIMDCARIDQPIIADGGMRKTGDIVKAFAAGAAMVMLGYMLAGTNEACGGTTYRGMASKEARDDHYAKRKSGWRAAEGVSISVQPKGPVADVIQEIVGGLRAGLSQAGAKTLGELRRKAQFIRATPAIIQEGHAVEL